MTKLVLAAAVVLLASCAHKPKELKEASDLEINKTYPVLFKEEVKGCTLKVQNVMTVIPKGEIPLPTELVVESKALVCGQLDCSKAELIKSVSMFECLPLEALQSSKSE